MAAGQSVKSPRGIDQEDSEEIETFEEHRQEIIAVPALLFYEIANVLATKTRLGEKDAVEAFSLIWEFDFEIYSFGSGEFAAGIALSKRYGISLYDAAYVKLARKLKCSFVTADRKLFEKVKNMKYVSFI